MFKLFHTADWQVEVRRNSQRYDEYKLALDTMYKTLSTDLEITKVTIDGDLFEFCQVTETERNLVVRWVKKVNALPHIREIIIHSGNHDLKQRFNDIQIGGENIIEDSVIDSLKITFSDLEKVQVFTKSGFYKSIDPATPKLLWGVWAHEHKFNGQLDTYNPWNTLTEPFEIDPNNVIELYHDPFQGAVGFNGQVQHGCENAIGFDKFNANTILGGDIHQHQVIKSDTGQTFTFPSSAIMRDFGEGDYYINTKRIVSGISNHGYYLHWIDETNNFVTESSEFVPLPIHTTRATFNINEKFDYNDISEMRLKYKSPFRNLVRLNIFGNEGAWHANSALIIEHLRKQADNLEITIDIDSSSIFAESSEDMELELDKLVTEEQILAIAIPYIKSKIQTTKKILPEDKERAESETVEMFKTQLSKIRRSVERNVIRFGTLSASNFLSYEDGVEVNFKDLKQLVKISGTNGIGKTNMMKLIKWITDDVIDSSQARNTTNQNAIDVFNDKRLDVNLVTATFTFDRNGKQYLLTKEIERSFKKAKEEITVKNWKEYIKGVQIRKTLVIRSIDGEQTLTDFDQVQAELSSIFGTVQDMESLLFTNATLLDRLVKSNPDALAEQIMHILGLRYFQDMANEYDALRKEKLAELAKPAENIEALTLSIADLKETQHNANHIVKTLEDHALTIDLELQAFNEEMGLYRESLIPVTETLEQVEQQIEGAKQIIELRKANITVAESEISDLETRQLTESEKFDELIESNIKERAEVMKEYDAIKAEADIMLASLEHLKSDVRTTSEAVKSEIMLEIASRYASEADSLNKSITAETAKKDSILEEIKDAKHAYEIERNKKRTVVDNRLREAKNSLEKANTDLQTHESMLKMYQGSTICKECKQELKGDAIKEIEERIKERELLIIDAKTCIEVFTKAQKEVLAELQTEYFMEDITTWLQREHGSKITEAKNIGQDITELTAKLNEQQEKRTAEESNIAEKIKSDAKVISAIKAYQDKNAEYTVLNQRCDSSHKLGLQNATRLDEIGGEIKTRKLRYDRIATDIIERQRSINEYRDDITTRNQLCDRLATVIESLEANAKIRVKITELEAKMTQTQNIQRDNANDLMNIKLKLEEAKNGIVRREKDVQDLITYRIMEASLAIYKTFIGKTGLNKVIFDAVSKKLNIHMNDLLQDSPYKLAFIDGILMLIDSSDPANPVTRTSSGFSGMQIILGGLSLFYVLRNASLGTKYDCVFIDEISGPLNDGKDLTYKAVDYKSLLVKMIGKMTETSRVLIVDHYLNFDDGSIIEVYPSNKGANIKVLA